ncbi:MAG: hypothetical protein AAB898_00025 [Patescibacteria group bacterium]
MQPKRHKPHRRLSPPARGGVFGTSAMTEGMGATPSDTVEHELKQIYAMDDGDEKHIDMSRLEIVRQPVVRRMLTATLLVLIAIMAGLLGALVLTNPLRSENRQVLTFDIAPEDPIVSGRPTTIRIPYQNTASVSLSSLEIEVHVPEMFVFQSAIPEPLKTKPLTWNVGSVGVGTQGEIALSGVFVAPPGTVVTLQVITRYVPSNFSSPFEAIESESILIDQSVFKVSMSGAERAIPGENVTYTIVAEHTEEVSYEQTELRLTLPSGFSIAHANPPPDEVGIAVWSLPTFSKDAPFRVEMTGTFASDVSGEQTTAAHMGTTLNDLFVPQAEAVFTTDVLASDLSLSLIVNGQTGDSIALPGDDITVNLSLDNRGEEAAENVVIELFVDRGLNRLNLAEREGVPDGDVYGNKINWDQTDMSRLKTLPGGEDASIDLAIPMREEGDTAFVLRAEARIETVGGIEINRKIESTAITVRVASDLTAAASARYFDASGHAIGSGPIPPKVGQTTTYRVTWTVANALNDVGDAVMVAAIPSDAQWAGLVSVSAGSVIYDTVGNRVRWTIGGMNDDDAPAVAVFDMRVTPTLADVGTFMDLLGMATLTATDTETNTTVSSITAALTSELPDDPAAENLGTVVE